MNDSEVEQEEEQVVVAKTPSPKKDEVEAATMKDAVTAPSPSRRSGRARKPSARQLAAEKSPLRESILGR